MSTSLAQTANYQCRVRNCRANWRLQLVHQQSSVLDQNGLVVLLMLDHRQHKRGMLHLLKTGYDPERTQAYFGRTSALGVKSGMPLSRPWCPLMTRCDIGIEFALVWTVATLVYRCAGKLAMNTFAEENTLDHGIFSGLPKLDRDLNAPRERHNTSRSQGKRIVVLTGGGPLPWVMINALVENFGALSILEEDKEPISIMMRRRARMLGYIEAAGQVAFGIWLKVLHKLSAHRKQEIVDRAGLHVERPANCNIIKIESVNSEKCQIVLQRLSPDVVVVLGTRMIKAKTLSSINATFMNYHAGLNPKYRGMNGGYWAHAKGDAENFGITVHLVDNGVDTGKIISFKRLTATTRDNFTTYPLLQAAAARNLLIAAVEDALEGRLETTEVPLASRQWFHPTIWNYFWVGLRKGVW